MSRTDVLVSADWAEHHLTAPHIVFVEVGEDDVLSELLRCRRVKNYDGSRTEYGSLVAVPVARGVAA